MNYVPFYSREEDAKDPHKLTDCEAFYISEEEAGKREYIATRDGYEDEALTEPGWYWWSCSPGCIPDSPETCYGPFNKMAEAIADAREQA